MRGGGVVGIQIPRDSEGGVIGAAQHMGNSGAFSAPCFSPAFVTTCSGGNFLDEFGLAFLTPQSAGFDDSHARL